MKARHYYQNYIAIEIFQKITEKTYIHKLLKYLNLSLLCQVDDQHVLTELSRLNGIKTIEIMAMGSNPLFLLLPGMRITLHEKN